MRAAITEASLKSTIVGALLGASLLAMACAGDPGGDSGKLLIAAAANLQPAFAELGEVYQRDTGTAVTITFGSSGNLATQIANGAPIDLFFSADERFILQLKDKGLILEGSDVSFAIGRLVLATNKKAGVEVGELNDLLQPEIKKIAVANPKLAPFGAAAVEALVNSGVWDNVETKVVYSENVRQALQLVQTGNTEVGFVSQSEVNLPEVEHFVVDIGLYSPIVQSMAIIKGAKRGEDARRFAEYILSASGASILKKYGYGVPGEP